MLKRRTTFLSILIAISLLSTATFSTVKEGAQSNKSAEISAMNSGGQDIILGSSIAKILATAQGRNISYQLNGNNAHNYAGTFRGELDGNTEFFYCIDINNPLAWWNNGANPYTDDAYTGPKITYILNNYYPFVATTNNERTEAAAVQMAIWHFSDDVDANTVSNNNAVRDRALEIIADANANAGNTEPVNTFIIDPGTQSNLVGDAAEFYVKVYTISMQPAPNVVVNLTASDGTLSATTVTTDENGIAGPVTLSQGSSNSATITATSDVAIPQGTRYVHQFKPDEKQKIVLATPGFDSKSVDAVVNWFEAADLSIVKTASPSTAYDGDQVTFSIAVTNDGPSDATGVEVTDFLPEGFAAVSSSVSTGSFDEATLIWDVGTIAAGATETLTLTVTVNVSVLTTTPFDLGPAKDFNLFLFNDLIQPSSDTEGKVAVGRDAYLANYSVGALLSPSGGIEDVLVVNRNLTFNSGAVYAGNVVYGRNTNLPINHVSISDGTLRKEKPIDWKAARSYLKNLSKTLKNYPANGTTVDEWGLKLTGTDPMLNIFTLDGDDLSKSTSMTINAPNGSVVVVNVKGKNISWSGALDVHGTDIGNVLFNFYQARNIHIVSIDVTGSILAPLAHLDFPSGVINGQVIANSMEGSGQFNNVKFIGNLPVNEEITNIAEVTLADVFDPDSEPGTGGADEDDYDEATVHVTYGGAGGVDSGGGDDGGGDANDVEWEQIGSFAANQVTWAMIKDADGSLIVGTIGGNIFKYTITAEGPEWQLLNEGMNVGFIWSLVYDQTQNKLYAGTEKGLFWTVDNGGVWEQPTDLADKDIRAITIDPTGSNRVFVGTWGTGIYLSEDYGQTWSDANGELSPNTAVHAMASASNGDIYAGTMGSGLKKSGDQGQTWENLEGFSSLYIWSLAVTNSDVIYAGTYGEGLFRSDDLGLSFGAVEHGGFPANYIYALCVDAEDNVFASTWTSGVFAGDADGSSWSNIGFSGIGSAGAIVDPVAGEIYVASGEGAIYRAKNPMSITSVETQAAAVPGEYALHQNYPNPFNPSTTISFNLPFESIVTLSVYNVAGEKITELVNTVVSAGMHQVNWNAATAATGIYVYRINAVATDGSGNFTNAKKMLLLK